ncbi:MAG: hypothetical protein IKG00_03730 [Lachnospiraceae bacterium]|nr:hypothetical protein [Lachnospiraceae bacterium]
MLVGWIIASVCAFGLCFICQGRCNEKLNRATVIYCVAYIIYSVITCAVIHKWQFGFATGASIGIGITAGLTFDSIKHKYSWLGDMIKGVLVTAVCACVLTFVLVLPITDAYTPRNSTPVKSETVKKTRSSSGSGKSTGTNKHPVDENCVYWVPSGGVWHSWSGCSSIRDSKTVYSGTISEAEEAGKERGCKLCTDY